MAIDLHIHSNHSDGRMTLEQIFSEANQRGIRVLSITDHDTMDGQGRAEFLARQYGIGYLAGLELNVTYTHPGYKAGRPISLDFLAYHYDPAHPPLAEKLQALRAYRQERAQRILENINRELAREDRQAFTGEDLEAIQDSVDGAFGRPHIANYMVTKGIVSTKQEAFDRYLVRCNVPKMPLSLAEASDLVRHAGGKLMLAHPNHPRGTSLISLTSSLDEQQRIIEETMLPHIDGVECWHSMHDPESTRSYIAFAARLGLMVCGGSDCHQNPVIMGSVDVPDRVAEQFSLAAR